MNITWIAKNYKIESNPGPCVRIFYSAGTMRRKCMFIPKLNRRKLIFIKSFDLSFWSKKILR